MVRDWRGLQNLSLSRDAGHVPGIVLHQIQSRCLRSRRLNPGDDAQEPSSGRAREGLGS